MEKVIDVLEDIRCEAQMYKQVLEAKWLRLAATEGMDKSQVLDKANEIMWETI